jgi:transcriptional regulator with XRE-family HTH domain
MNAPDERSNVSRESVAAEVRAALARAQRSGRNVAAALGWTQPYMSRRLNGDRPFDVDDLTAIADELGVPVVSFFQVAASFTRRRLVTQPALHPIY